MTPSVRSRSRPRGAPLALLLVLLAGWSTGRVMWWESPFAAAATARAQPMAGSAMPPVAAAPPILTQRMMPAAGPARATSGTLGLLSPAASLTQRRRADRRTAPGRDILHRPGITAGPEPAMMEDDVSNLRQSPPFLAQSDSEPGRAAPLAATATPLPVRADRWSLDAWAFWRQGSNAAPISQGRVPVYGANQAGAVLQYRLAPSSRRDPRAYARAYRALVRQGESELALGVSARPVGRVPLRAAAELRFTDSPFGTVVRPAAYVVSEFAPLALPYGTRLEAYGQAGWVGGDQATAFADGQASLTREVRIVAARSHHALRLSVGAGAWGGAQKGAERIDIGPTLRLDLTLGKVPARVSVDWRERVGGQAGPDSGLAATVSTRF